MKRRISRKQRHQNCQGIRLRGSGSRLPNWQYQKDDDKVLSLETVHKASFLAFSFDSASHHRLGLITRRANGCKIGACVQRRICVSRRFAGRTARILKFDQYLKTLRDVRFKDIYAAALDSLELVVLTSPVLSGTTFFEKKYIFLRPRFYVVN